LCQAVLKYRKLPGWLRATWWGALHSEDPHSSDVSPSGGHVTGRILCYLSVKGRRFLVLFAFVFKYNLKRFVSPGFCKALLFIYLRKQRLSPAWDRARSGAKGVACDRLWSEDLPLSQELSIQMVKRREQESAKSAAFNTDIKYLEPYLHSTFATIWDCRKLFHWNVSWSYVKVGNSQPLWV
jgi:hypothetical protein